MDPGVSFALEWISIIKKIFHAKPNHNFIQVYWEYCFFHCSLCKFLDPQNSDPHIQTLGSSFVQAWIYVSEWWFLHFILTFPLLVLKKKKHLNVPWSDTGYVKLWTPKTQDLHVYRSWDLQWRQACGQRYNVTQSHQDVFVCTVTSTHWIKILFQKIWSIYMYNM